MGIHGGKILSEKLKKGKTSNLPIKAKLTQDNIKSRNYDLAREEGLKGLRTEKDLRILQKRLHEKYTTRSE